MPQQLDNQLTSPLDPRKVAAVMRENAAMGVLVELPIAQAIGAACSYLLWASMNAQTETRRVLNERIVRQGFTGDKLINELIRAAK